MQQSRRQSKRSDSPSSDASHDSSFYSTTTKNKQRSTQSMDMNNHAHKMKKPILPKGYCTTCSKPSICRCKRCGDFYCSPECQRKDWSSHRYICFPMPSLVYAEELCESYDNGPVPSLEDNSNNQKNATAFSKGNNEMRNAYSKGNGQAAAPSKNERVKLINQNNSPKQFTQISPPTVPYPKHESCVIFAGFKTVNRCYIRSSNPSDVEGYAKLMKKLNQYGKNAPKLLSPPQPYAYYITLHHGEYCRVQITSDNRDNLRVLFVDYGFIEPRSVKDLYEISDEILALPCFLKLIQLNGVYYSKDRKMDEDKLKRLSEYENREFKVLWVKEGVDIPVANLLHWQTNKSLSNEINNLLKINKPRDGVDDKPNELNDFKLTIKRDSKPYSTPNGEEVKDSKENDIKSPKLVTPSNDQPNIKTPSVKMTEEDNKTNKNSALSTVMKDRLNKVKLQCMEPPFKTILFAKDDQNLNVLAIDNSAIECGFVACLLKEHLQNLIDIQTYLCTSYKDNNQPYKPKVNEHCIAKFEDGWYRAKICQILSPDEYLVVYTDFTNELSVGSDKIRSYPMELTNNCYTNLCFINGLPEKLSEVQINFLKKEFDLKKPFHIDRVVSVEDHEMPVIECREILQKMRDGGLLE